MVADPAKFPRGSRNGFEGVQDVGGEKAGETASATAPTAVNQNAAAAFDAREEVRGSLVRANNLCGMHRIHNADVNDLVLVERPAVWEVIDPRARFNGGRFNAARARAGAVDGDVGQVSAGDGHWCGAAVK